MLELAKRLGSKTLSAEAFQLWASPEGAPLSPMVRSSTSLYSRELSDGVGGGVKVDEGGLEGWAPRGCVPFSKHVSQTVQGDMGNSGGPCGREKGMGKVASRLHCLLHVHHVSLEAWPVALSVNQRAPSKTSHHSGSSLTVPPAYPSSRGPDC